MIAAKKYKLYLKKIHIAFNNMYYYIYEDKILFIIIL